MKQHHINKYQPHRGSECRLTASPNGRQSYIPFVTVTIYIQKHIFWLYLIQRIYRITKKSYVNNIYNHCSSSKLAPPQQMFKA